MTGEVSKSPGKIPEYPRTDSSRDPSKKADSAKRDPTQDQIQQIGAESLTYGQLPPDERIEGRLYAALPVEAQKVAETGRKVISKPLPSVPTQPTARRPLSISMLSLPPGKTKADFTLLGSGSFGEVRLAQTVQGDHVAIKYRKKASNEKEEQKEAQDFENEVRLHQRIKPHPNVLRCYGKTEDGGCVLEYVDAGDLKKTSTESSDLLSCLSVIKTLPSERRKVVENQIVKDIFNGMAHLESLQMFHRDLAARNVLLGQVNGECRAKIADFGMARTLGHAQVEESEGVISYKSTSNSGPLKWMAPESIFDRTSNSKSDVYACAITIWEILSGEEPYPDTDALKAAVEVATKGNKLNFNTFIKDGVNPEFIELMKKCVKSNPSERPTFAELVEFMQTHELYLSVSLEKINQLKAEIGKLEASVASMNAKLTQFVSTANHLQELLKGKKPRNREANLAELAKVTTEISNTIKIQKEIGRMLETKNKELADLQRA